MPIYAYKCETCGHAADVLQKISDPLLTKCPACGADTYVKQVTAAGFQLKGSGWYVTDFRDGGGKKPDLKNGGEDKSNPAAEAKPDSKPEAAATPAPAAASTPAPATPAPSSPPAAASPTTP